MHLGAAEVEALGNHGNCCRRHMAEFLLQIVEDGQQRPFPSAVTGKNGADAFSELVGRRMHTLLPLL